MVVARKLLLPLVLLALVSLGIRLAARCVNQRMADEDFDSCRQNIRNFMIAVEMYSTDYAGRYPPSLQLLVPNYLRTLPTCPANGSDTYSPSYSASYQDRQDRYTVRCTGDHRGATLAKQGNPRAELLWNVYYAVPPFPEVYF